MTPQTLTCTFGAPLQATRRLWSVRADQLA